MEYNDIYEIPIPNNENNSSFSEDINFMEFTSDEWTSILPSTSKTTNSSKGKEEYIVEKILAKRSNENGSIEYLVRRRYYKYGDNSSESTHNHNYSDLNKSETKKRIQEQCKITKSESKLSYQQTSSALSNEFLTDICHRKTCLTETSIPKQKTSAESLSLSPSIKDFAINPPREPERIISVTNICGSLVFMMKWKGRDLPEMILATEANIKYPQHVITFYEETVKFNKTKKKAKPDPL